MKEKSINSILFSSLLILIACNNIKASAPNNQLPHQNTSQLKKSNSSPQLTILLSCNPKRLDNQRNKPRHRRAGTCPPNFFSAQNRQNDDLLDVQDEKIYDFQAEKIQNLKIENNNLSKKHDNLKQQNEQQTDQLKSQRYEKNRLLPHVWSTVIAGAADGLLSCFAEAEKSGKNENLTLLHQSVKDTKELEILSCPPAILGGPFHEIVNGYDEEGSMLKKGFTNFVGETTNAFGLRYFREPIANRCKHITRRLKDSKNPIVKATLKKPCLYFVRLAAIRSLWRLEKLTIKQIFT